MNIICLFKHKWKIEKSIKASNLILLIKKHKAILKRSTFELEKDYVVEDRKCARCGKENFEIGDTKKLFEQELANNLKMRK